MIEPIQILLFTVIIVLTVLVVVIGWQIYQILVEMRKMLTKFNLMAQGAVDVTSRVNASLNSLSGVSEGIRTAMSLLRIFSKKEHHTEHHHDTA